MFDSLYNRRFRPVLDIEWLDHDRMLMMIMITLLTDHRQLLAIDIQREHCI